MTSRRRLGLIGIGVLVLVLLVAIATPLLLDVERHRERIERALAEATGWDAELGDLGFSVMRGIAVTVSPARLADPGGDSEVSIESIGIRAELLPLLRGELNVKSVELGGPEIALVREAGEAQWSLPLPTTDSTETDRAGGGVRVSVDRIRLSDGRLRLEDRSAEPPAVFRLVGISAELDPTNGSASGSAAFPDDGGTLAWSGGVGEAIVLTLDSVTTEALGSWLGEGLVHPGGRLDGEAMLDLPSRVTARLGAEDLLLLAGDTPLGRAELEVELVSRDGGWLAERLVFESGGARVSGSGPLLPELDLSLELPATDVEPVLALSRAMLPLELGLRPPGKAGMRLRLRQPEGGELTYEAQGQLEAAGFVLGGVLPEVQGLRTTFELSPEGALELEIDDATVGGGPLRGTMRIDQVDPPGTLELDGKLSQASLGALLAGMVDKAPERVVGPVALEARVTLDLGAPEPDARALGGRLALGAERIGIAGWDLEQALLSKLEEKLGALAGIASLLDSRLGQTKAADDLESARQVLDRMLGNVSFDEIPWRLDRVELECGGVTALGSGTFDPTDGSVELALSAKLSRKRTAAYVERFRQLRSLVDESGRLTLPLRLRGPFTGPDVDLDLAGLLPDSLSEDPEETIKGLLKGLIDR